MAAVDNSNIVRQFVPEKWDGDTYVYTELLDRRKTKGNNGFRLVKSFFHRSRKEFDNQLGAIRQLCDWYGSRAYTRISPRSFRKTAGTFLSMVTEAYIASNYDGMKSLYNKACGNVAAETKYWMFDVDVVSEDTELFFWNTLLHVDRQGNHVDRWNDSVIPFPPDKQSLFNDKVVCHSRIPSKTGWHYITKPFDIRKLEIPVGIELKKDANTNLYIPDGAE